MTRISLTETAHQIIKKSLHKGDVAIDATCGNGHDTVFLALQVGNTGHVYGFDIQQKAIDATATQLKTKQLEAWVRSIHASHIEMAKYVTTKHHGNIQAIMFNLGYLPGGDKSLITKTESTLLALNSALHLLAKNGVLTILVYPGHPGGDSEAEQVKFWLEQLDQKLFSFTPHHSHSVHANAPILYSIEKIST